MFNGLNIHTVSFPLANTASDWQGDDVVGHLFPAPTIALGGGIKIVAAYAVNGAATTSGTSFSLKLEKWGTAGTADGGDISSALGGTADPWAASTPKTFTLSDDTLSAGEWLVVRKNETNSSDPTRCSIILQYVMGN